ncbi:hypothetical protein F5B22DRAFT_350496 [Xylaria bambusicola]|uniref:uncharacterized protein n=1 Tax=Xylaria bambusicola TaxID=326684 RepID=UPI002008B424|nr:uncharacterized protein F5B22DRAFT_350496 [Xylaria bambusicola]KAI0525588.1 hypothetical protein F5B22DRAFT_350496 [Xylaria bambusicola]
MSVADTPMKTEPDGVGNIRFCDLCNKPIVSETAFKRHLAYCRRTAGKPKKRKRSCRECHRAKAKCSFERQCFRCLTRGLTCEYEKPAFPSANSESGNEVQDSSTPEPAESSPSDGTGSPGSSDLFLNHEITLEMVYLHQNIPPRSAVELRRDPKHQANAIFILETLRSVPYMMSRRENFPMFIHGQWHEPEVPVTITNCMRICELYIARNTSPHGRELFYTAVSEEAARFAHHLFTSSREDTANMLSVQSLYTTMAVFEDYRPQASCTPDLVVRECDVSLMTSLARQCFNSDNYEPFDVDKNDDPDQTWEQFIYAESRRRCALFWFIVSRVIDLRHGLTCPPVVGYRGLSLPAPGVLWSARTREEWEAARAEIRAHRQEPLYNTTLRTMGDLIESRERAFDPDCARQLSNWLAGCDKLGLMVEIASTMI